MNWPGFQSGLPGRKGFVFALFLAVFWILSCSKNAANLPGILFAPGSATRPSVVLSSPSPLTPNVPSDIPVYVEFDREMRSNETENAFTLSGSAPTPGHFVWSGKRLEYRLDGPLATGNSFVLVQGGSSISKDGYPMEVDYIVHFISGSSVTGPQVLSVAPANNSQNVATTSTIRFIFSRPMDIPSTQTAFSISPAAPGSFSWDPDQRGFTYTPTAALTFATTYTVSLNVGARDTTGNPLAATSTTSFQAGTDFVPPTITNLFEVGNVTPLSANQTGIRKDSAFQIVFSEPVQFQTVQNAFSLVRQSDSSASSGTWQWNPTFTTATFTPGSPLEPLHFYRASLGNTVLDIAGNSLQSAYHLDFYVDNSNGATNSDYLQAIAANQTAPLPLSSLTISPAALSTVTLPGCLTGANMTIRVDFDHSLNLSTVAENLSISRTVGINPHVAQIIGLSFATTTRPNDQLVIYLGDVGCNEYEVKIFGKAAGIRTAPVGAETGSWMQSDALIYMRVQ